MKRETNTIFGIVPDADGGRPGKEGSLSGEMEEVGEHECLLLAASMARLVQEAEEGWDRGRFFPPYPCQR
ncbi:NADP-dependent malic enzyme [Sesbania bispinosa]|nr:NADP-dependent malic enzyme [Sesbania bispinosa]